MSQIKEFVSTKTAAKELGIALRTVQNLIKEGKLPARKFGRINLIDRKIFEEWKARNIVAA